MVGVVNVNSTGSSRVLPATERAFSSIVTVYCVAYGSCLSGVKMSVVVPDHRNMPFTLGEMWNHGAVTGLGIRPRTTIGSEKSTRTSLASSRDATSPDGPALTTRKVSAAKAAVATSANRNAATAFLIASQSKSGLDRRK